MKKLSLNRETVRRLETRDLRRAQGGVATLVINVCDAIGTELSKLKLNCNLT